MAYNTPEKAAAYQRKYHSKNRELLKIKNKEYRIKNRQIIKDRHNKWASKNEEWIKAYRLKYAPKAKRASAIRYRKNKDYYAARAKAYVNKILSDPVKADEYRRKQKLGWIEWAKRNPVLIKEICRRSSKKYKSSPGFAIKRRLRERERRISDPMFCITRRLRSRLHVAMKRGGGVNKTGRTLELVGCSIRNLKAHIESLFLSGMTWANRSKWHIDHIRPCASFNLLDPEQQKCCFHYTNLQPLWAADNIQKSDKI